MTPGSLRGELLRTGKLLSKWRAELEGALWAAAVLLSLWAFALTDVFCQLGRPGRVATWLALVALIGFAAWRVSRALAAPHTVEGVASTVERNFPTLDNHLINFVQFAAEPDNAFKEAYVSRGVPGWESLEIRQMKDRKRHRRANIVLGVAAALFLFPVIVSRQTWPVAIWRIVNPFSNCKPVSLTRIVAVDPGDVSVRQGDPLIVTCTLVGQKGHRVWLDLDPSDDKKATVALGRIVSGGPTEFSYRLPRVTTGLSYRFRAGDAPFPQWYAVDARAPLSFSQIELAVAPPDYTGFRSRRFDALADSVEIPQASRIGMRVACNMELKALTAEIKGQEPVSLSPGDDGVWAAAATVKEGGVIRFVASATTGEQADADVAFTLIADRAPNIVVTSPKGRTALGPGVLPEIEFEVGDDHGLVEVSVERVEPGSVKTAKGDVLDTWTVPTGQTFEKRWKCPALAARGGQPLAFRIVARDNYPFDARRGRSTTILFDTVAANEAAEREAEAQARAAETLTKLIGLQRENMKETKKYVSALDAATENQWLDAAAKQRLIRQLASDLLGDPLRPLGGLTPVVRQLYLEEMLEVIGQLERVPREQAEERHKVAARGLSLENTILRKLTYAEVVVDRTKQKRKISGLIAMIEALVKGQTVVIGSTKQYVDQNAEVGETLIDDQDELASDVSDFVGACRREAPALEITDKNFADLVLTVADTCEAAKIKEDMLQAAEALDQNEPVQALPLEVKALAGLKELHQMLNKWQVATAEERYDEVLEALADAKERLQKLRKLQEETLEAMRQIEPSKNEQSDADLMEEDIAEIEKNTKEALLQIGIDLHIFPELAVANELVEDCFGVFEEVQQVEGSDEGVAEEAEEVGVLKPEMLIEDMKKAEGRMDQMEMWLENKPEKFEWNMEAFDKEEMPKKIALGALPTEMEDLIGDLLEESQEVADKTEDSATNQAVPDMPPGWGVAEGPTESFGAQGRSGNQTPDHKEQSGRSNVGRQGQSMGETAAGSGTIGEGDKNIEERMTPDPVQGGQVQVDGEADEKATGGGKQGSGSADQMGMAGAGGRMDATSQGLMEGLEALMAKTQSLHVKASLMNLRTESLAAAAHHIHQASDAIAKGLPISQVRELQRRAVASLKEAQTELGAGVGGYVDSGQLAVPLENVIEGGKENAPPAYRDLVAEYFKSLNDSI